MRTLLTLLLLLPLTVQGQAIWRNFFVTNQNPRVTVVAGSNATVQASTIGVDQRIFTVNAIPGAAVNTNDLNGWLSTNVAGFAGYATNAGFATNATYALWGTNSFYVLTAILTNQIYGSNVVGAVSESTHATNADNASNSTNFWGVLAPTNLPAGLSTSNYVGTLTGNGAGITNLSQGSYTGTLTNAINSTNATLTGPIQIYGDSYRTNGWYYSNGGVLTSNANGSVNMAGGNITATGTITGNGSGITNVPVAGPDYATSLLTVQIFDDLFGPWGGGTIGSGPASLNVNANSGSIAPIENYGQGVANLSTLSSATSAPILGLNAQTVNKSMLCAGGVIITNEWRVFWKGYLPSATENFTNLIGITDSVTGALPANGAYFQFDTNDVHLKCITAKSSSYTIVTNTTTVAHSTWYRLRVVLSTNSAIFTVNGADAATNTLNLPTSTPIAPSVQIIKGGGTTAREFLADYLYLAYRLTTSR